MRISASIVILTLGANAWSQEGKSNRGGDWPYWGGDPGAKKYSELDQIHRGNVSDLKLAWLWKTGEKAIPDRRALTIENGIPINKPPYGVLTAIDMDRGEHVFQVPMGDDESVRSNKALAGVELPKRLGSVGATGPIVTRGGLLFVSGGDDALYAFDKATGEELWSFDLGQRSNANPMTYLGKSGRQYVVIATGLGEGAELMAFALPR